MHALLLREVAIFIAPAPSVDEAVARVLLCIKVPAWERRAARPSDCFGSAVFWERHNPKSTS